MNNRESRFGQKNYTKLVKISYKIDQNIIQNWPKYYTKLAKILYKIGQNIIQNWSKYFTKLVKILYKIGQIWTKTS